MRTLTLHTADELAARWLKKAHDLDREAEAGFDRYALTMKAQAYRVCATELRAIVAVSMEQAAIDHGDPE